MLAFLTALRRRRYDVNCVREPQIWKLYGCETEISLVTPRVVPRRNGASKTLAAKGSFYVLAIAEFNRLGDRIVRQTVETEARTAKVNRKYYCYLWKYQLPAFGGSLNSDASQFVERFDLNLHTKFRWKLKYSLCHSRDKTTCGFMGVDCFFSYSGWSSPSNVAQHYCTWWSDNMRMDYGLSKLSYAVAIATSACLFHISRHTRVNIYY